ncbi:MAG: N-acetylneuraminate synthase family protein [Thermodesulfobacteriota bacterium]|nr:N-acetylneuraminate synthase family protein [Thermodesulfobacteriota bacterium]
MKIIAECCLNHGGDMTNAKQLITDAKQCGCDIVKFQYLNADDLNMDMCNEEDYKYYKKRQLDLNQLMELKMYAEEEGIEWLCSVFNKKRAEEYLQLDAEWVKIGAGAALDFSLVEFCKEKFKNIIISCGMMTKKELLDLRLLISFKQIKCIYFMQTIYSMVFFYNPKIVNYNGLSIHLCNWAKIFQLMGHSIDNEMEFFEVHFKGSLSTNDSRDDECSVPKDILWQMAKYRDYFTDILKNQNNDGLKLRERYEGKWNNISSDK